MDSPSGRPSASATRSNGHESLLTNTSAEVMSDKSPSNEYASTRRDGPLAQQLAHKLSVVANTSISSTASHAHYKNSPDHFEEQEQVSPSACAWGFLPSPTADDPCSDIQSAICSQTSSTKSAPGPAKDSGLLVESMETSPDQEKIPSSASNACSLQVTSDKAQGSMNDQIEELFKPRIILQKIQFDDPAHCPPELTPDMIKEILRERFLSNPIERPLRSRRSNDNGAQSDKSTPKKKRHRAPSDTYKELDDDEEDDDDRYPLLRKRIRRTAPTNENSLFDDPISALHKKTRDRLARKALEIDADPQGNTSYQRFVQMLDIFNEDYERHHDQFEDNIDDPYLDLLLSDQTLEEMSVLSEKLKLSTYMTRIDRSKLKRLLELLSLRIKQGIEVSPILKHDINDEHQEAEHDERAWRDLVFERLTMSTNACELALNIMTTPNMPKEILLEHVIEHTALFIKGQLAKTIFPEYDPLYRSDNQSKDPLLTKQKRSKVTGAKCKQVQILYNKIVSLFQGITDLMPLGKFTDTIILAISSFSVSCIYVENIFDLQAHSLIVLAELFSRYEHHRDSILDDLLLSIVRLPTSKKSLRCYRLPSGESIQMFTALIMHLIHSPICAKNNEMGDAGNELQLLSTYATAQNLAFKFLTLFFRSCGTKQGEDDHRMVFENFLADLLLTANRPEWPAAEILLTLLSRILMKNFSNHSLPLQMRLQSLDYLGLVAAQLRKDSIDNHELNSRENRERLDQVVEKTLSSLEMEVEVIEVYRTDPLRYHRSLVIYLNELSQYEPTSHFAKMFHLGQWVRDVNLTIERLTQTLTRQVKPVRAELVDDEIDESMHANQKPVIPVVDEIEMKKTEKSTLMKMLGLPTVTSLRKQQPRYPCDIDYDEICLLMRYLSSNRPFLKTFDVYLKQLAAIFQSEAGSNLRSKAMKCLCTVVEADPTILARNDIKSCVQVGLTDKSISVREAAIDLIGRYIVQKQQLILQYYDVLCERSIDTGVSVRKRVVKIFRDVSLTQSNFVRIPDICARLLRRIHDEESIRKLVLDTFQQLWFTPTRDQYEIRHRVQTIIDVLIDGQKQSHTWLENLIKDFLQTNEKQSSDDKKKIREQRQDVLKAIQDIINELVESILKIESANDQISSNKLVSTFIAIYALGKAKPEHVLPHFSTIVEYLNIKCTSYNDNVIVQYVAKILEFTVPLMRSASSSVIYSLEGSLTKLLLVSGQLVIHASIACLSAAVRLSKNISLVKEVFLRYHTFVVQCRENINDECKSSAQLARSIYILGVLCKYFDVERSEYDDLEFSVEDLFQVFLFFIERPDPVVKLKSLVGLGFFLQRYGQYLVEDTVRQMYHTYLLDRHPSAGQLRCQVLINLEDYFRDCIRRMAEHDVDYLQTTAPSNEIDETLHDVNATTTGVNLKETADVHSEMASSIAQCYLHVVLETYLSDDEIIRQCVRKVVSCILEQGLVHPVQFIPYLIAMTTDRDINIQQSAEQNLQDLDKTNPGIIQTKVMQGLKMSYQLQKLLTTPTHHHSQAEVIRGMTKVAITSFSNQQMPYCSANHFLYSLIRSSRVYRRALIGQLLKMFDSDVNHSTLTLDEQLFVADNLAYFPYQVQDEPLFLVEQIDLAVSVNGSTQLQHFRELLKQHFDYIDDDEGIDLVKLEERLCQASEPKIDELQQCLRITKPIMLLLLLKSYLKDVYCLNDTKIIEYDHSECSKLLDRPIANRKINVQFEPKMIIETIKPTCNYDNLEKRRQIIREFGEFKRTLLAYDNDVEDTIHSISELLPASVSTSKGKKKGPASSKRRKAMIDSDDDDSFDC